MNSNTILHKNCDIIFTLLFLLFSLFYYKDIISSGPTNIHSWRQSDCLSISYYYYKGADLFSPEMHFQGADDLSNEKTAGEFPILYYIVGQIWKVTGVSHLAYRLFYLVILFLGLFSFYKSIQLIFKNNFWAICTSLLLFTCPVYVFYGVSFLTDVPAISFIFIALYHLIKYHTTRKTHWIYFSMLFITFAGLIKISSLIVFVFLLFIFIIEMFRIKSLGDKKLVFAY